jgi:transposase InsO family protein
MHKNARLTPKGRALMLARLEAGQHQGDVAQAMGVSLTTLKKWLRRYRAEGAMGLLDRPCRPRCSPRRVSGELTAQVIALRHQRRTGRFICQRLRLSAASVSRILRRARLSRWRDLEPRVPVRRYEREHPGELLHLDVKKLGRIQGIGHRITGDRRGQSNHRGIGWEFVHVAIDDASRLALAKVASDEHAGTVTELFKSTVEHYRGLGIRVQGVMTDNGNPYVSRDFQRLCRELGIRHLRTKPYTPRTNGKAERFIQTCLREWAYAEAYTSSSERTVALAHWLHHYNWHRPHSALHSMPPITKLGLKGNNLLKLHN